MESDLKQKISVTRKMIAYTIQSCLYMLLLVVGVCLFGVDAFPLSQQFFCHVGTFSGLIKY